MTGMCRIATDELFEYIKDKTTVGIHDYFTPEQGVVILIGISAQLQIYV